jgi:hypothetical protein
LERLLDEASCVATICKLDLGDVCLPFGCLDLRNWPNLTEVAMSAAALKQLREIRLMDLPAMQALPDLAGSNLNRIRALRLHRLSALHGLQACTSLTFLGLLDMPSLTKLIPQELPGNSIFLPSLMSPAASH